MKQTTKEKTTLEIYGQIVHEINLATGSGDITALLGIEGMVRQKETLEKQLGLNQYDAIDLSN